MSMLYNNIFQICKNDSKEANKAPFPKMQTFSSQSHSEPQLPCSISQNCSTEAGDKETPRRRDE